MCVVKSICQLSSIFVEDLLVEWSRWYCRPLAARLWDHWIETRHGLGQFSVLEYSTLQIHGFVVNQASKYLYM